MPHHDVDVARSTAWRSSKRTAGACGAASAKRAASSGTRRRAHGGEARRDGRFFLVMGVSVWSFLRPRPGELHPVTQSAVEAFISGGGRLPADADGFVRYAQVIVSLRDRRAVEVLRVGLFQYRALTDGTLDREHFREIMAVIPQAAFGWVGVSQSPPRVVGAEHKFAQRRLDHMSRWKPTRAEQANLRELVNRRAGRDII